MVPQGRIELPTSSLPMMRSTTELLRPIGINAPKLTMALALVEVRLIQYVTAPSQV